MCTGETERKEKDGLEWEKKDRNERERKIKEGLHDKRERVRMKDM